MYSIISRGAAIGMALAALVPLAARADGDIPSYQALSCEHDCPAITPAKIVNAPAPVYPHEYRGRFSVFVESLVDVDFTIAADGSVKDAAIEQLLGPQAFADSALAAVTARKYQPAAEDGKPVEENHRVRFVFEISNGGQGGRASVVRDYNRAMQLARDGKSAEALAALNDIAARPELNFYERTMVSYSLALLDAQTGDYLSGRDAIRVATIERGSFLDPVSVADAMRLRVRLEAMSGDFAESFAWFAMLRDRGLTTPTDPEKILVEKLHSLIQAPEPLAMEARIPPTAPPNFWQHTLLRRSFEFHEIVGKLDRFELRCQRHSILSAVSDKADWTVPASWGGCFINVTGAPGTKFRFVELQPAKP